MGLRTLDLGITLVLAQALTGVGCGAEPVEDVDVATSAFSEESCKLLSLEPDVRLSLPAIPGGPSNAATSDRTYNTCYKSFVADVWDWAGPATLSATWADALPVTKAACEATEGAVMWFQTTLASDWELISTERATGRWVQVNGPLYACQVPAFRFATNLDPGQIWWYRVAATMRLTSGNNPTRAVRIAIN